MTLENARQNATLGIIIKGTKWRWKMHVGMRLWEMLLKWHGDAGKDMSQCDNGKYLWNATLRKNRHMVKRNYKYIKNNILIH